MIMPRPAAGPPGCGRKAFYFFVEKLLISCRNWHWSLQRRIDYITWIGKFFGSLISFSKMEADHAVSGHDFPDLVPV
jgi:hypothetical protein